MTEAEDKLALATEASPNVPENTIDNTPSPPTVTCNTTTLFVGGLHPRVGDLHLQKLFSPYGSINRIHIVTNKPGGGVSTHSNSSSKSKAPSKYAFASQQSKGYAFVEYSSVESAKLAMSRLDGRTLLGKNLVVRPAKRQKTDCISTGEKIVSAEDAKRECKSVQSKIDSLKRAIEQKKKGF